MMNKVEGIVIHNEDFKEADGLVSLLTPEKILTVRARGIRKGQSKNRSVCQPFSLIEWMIEDKNTLPLLINGRLMQYYRSIQSDLSAQAVCLVLRDCIIRFGTSTMVYTCFLKVLSCFETNNDNAYAWAVLLLKDILVHEGIQPYTDGCVHCRRKDRLQSISLGQGGFLCREHTLSTDLKQTKEELIRTYSLFHVRETDLERFVDTFHFSMEDIVYWAKWLEHYSHVSLKSIRFLETVSGMGQHL